MNIEKLITAAKEIEVRYKKVEERTKFMQNLAAEAHRMGKSLTHRMSEAPTVVNFEDPIRDLINALHSKPFDPTKNIGKQCIKDKKPFKSGLKVNTIKGIINHPILQIPAYTFVEDDSFVECRRCKIISNEEAIEIIKAHSKELWKKLEKAFRDSENTPDSLIAYEKAAKDFAIVRHAIFKIEVQEKKDKCEKSKKNTL